MKFKIISFFFLSLSLEFFAQSFSLSGYIRDMKTGKVLDGAVVILNNNHHTVTNNRGYYSFKNLFKGSYSVKVSRLGYKSFPATVIIENEAVTKDFSIEPSPIEFDEVLVNSNRASKYLRNSPYSELLIDKTQIETRSFQSVSDVLKEQPGLSLLRDGIWGIEINIRGLSRENLVTLIDGNRIATSTDVAARLSMIDLDDVERIEVIKGASSSIYGSGATGGIINVITKTPSFNENFMLKGNFSSGLSTVNKMLFSSGSINTGNSFWSSKISGSFRKAGNTKTPAGELKNSQFKDYSFSATINFIPLENNLLKFNYQLFKADDVGIPGASVFLPNAEVRYPDEKREMISAGYEIQNISKLFYKFSLKYSYQVIDRNVENLPHVISIDTIKAIRATVLKINPSATHKNNNLQIQSDFILGENNNLVLGLDYWDRNYSGIREKFQKIETLASDGSVLSTTNKVVGEKPLPDSKYKSLGFFAQDDAALLDEKLFLTIGARIDKIYVSGESTLNPLYEIVNGKINYTPKGQKIIWNRIKTDEISNSSNLGLKYLCNEKIDLTLSLGYSFRSPSLEERFQYIDQGGLVRVGDPNLKSEKGKSVDLGFRYYTSDFKLISSIFYNRFKDLVSEIPGTFEGKNAFVKTNIGEAQLYGFDLHSEYNFLNDYIFHFTASYVKGDDITAKSNLPGIPPLNGNAGIKFTLLNYLVADFSSTIFAQQNKIATGEMKTPGYVYFNLSCTSTYIEFGLIEAQAAGGIENIFNKDYRNHLSTGRGFIKSEPGRNIFLKLNLKW
ncbi:MAG: TonB-dependent receptor [Ignavibacteriaceae bacterium]|jgi:hemoglobin/transferrin/lactoferrin receptor protein